MLSCRHLLSLVAAMLLLAACGKEYSHTEATVDIAPDKIVQRQEWAAVKDSGQVGDGWLADFNDPVLDALVNEAMGHNPDLQAAAARVDRAWALAAAAGAELKPSIGLGGRLAGVTEPAYRPAQGVGAGVSWELDVWGRLGQGARAAEESARSAEARYEFARQSLAASTAKAWFMACETRIMLDYLNSVVGILERMTAIVIKKNQVGQVSRLDVHQINAQLASAREAAVKAGIAMKKAVRGLETLVGRYPSAELEAAGRLTALPGPIPAGMPSDILSRRPDLIAAEDTVAAAFYAQRGAELLHLPAFTIQAGAMTNLNQAIAGLTGGVIAPIYTGGAIEAQIAQATAAQKEAVAAYAATALKAFREVENALSNEMSLAERETYLETAVSESGESFRLSEMQYKVGRTDLFKTLDLQSKWIGSRITLLDVQRERLDNRVDLHLALGGSMEGSPDSGQAAEP
ncbi:TolC family protein [Pseudodesulfovibrio sp.]|uniref:TolC family protein n=1 Tax=Pseudodesulfovibrio sp. TaxID=2035812 RepID=UPI00261985E1|nr:TolC family protein [Pseudodesulfovibrio sp.]MDD3311372.1 TolC family protein [Pseudodesulfovibrio sp.]